MPGIEPASSWILVRFVTTEPGWELHELLFPDCVSFVPAFILFYFIFVVVVAISWAAPAAYGGSQARGGIGATAAGLHHSHSTNGSKPSL